MPRGVNVYDEAELQKRLWSPAIMRTALWLDANDLSTISVATGISEWRDKSGNQRNFTQGTGAVQPSFTPNGLNGRNVLSYNGSQYLTSVSTVGTWNFLHNANGSTVFGVWKAGNVSDPNAIYALLGNNAAGSVNTGYYILYDDRVSSLRNDVVVVQVSRGVVGQTAVTAATANGVHPANTPVLISQVADPNNGTAANRSFLRINQSLTQGNTATNVPVSTDASFALQIGACGNNTAPMVGYIAEIVVFSSIVNDRVRQQVEGYLAWKWGLRTSLVASHPFRNRPPMIGD
jgi:hypothetical protein